MKKINSIKNVKRDIVIIGAGPAGLSLACSLADTNLKITVIEKQSVKHLSSPSYDGREIALTHFSKKIAEEQGTAQKSFSEKAIKLLQEYDWTGNIRELRNVVERLLILGEKEVSEKDVKLFASK